MKSIIINQLLIQRIGFNMSTHVMKILRHSIACGIYL